MQTVFMVGDEPIQGYKLLESLGGSAFYRLWKVRAPDGSTKLWKEIDLVVGNAAIETRTLGLLVQLRHPYLNTLTNFWQLDDGNTLVIETEVPVMSLRQRLEQGKKQGKLIPPEELQEYIAQAAEGLDFLNSPRHHHQGQQVAIYHRALTPESLLLFQEGSRQVCKVSDFGLAKPVTEQNAQHSQGLLHYDYDPPEFFEGKTAPTSDQYALGINYYELRTGSLPFPGSMLDQLQSKLSDKPDLQLLQDPERSIVRKALAADPAHRYENCTAFARQLALNTRPAGNFPSEGESRGGSPLAGRSPASGSRPSGLRNAPPASSPVASAGADARGMDQPTPRPSGETPGVVFHRQPAEQVKRSGESPAAEDADAVGRPAKNVNSVVAALRTAQAKGNQQSQAAIANVRSLREQLRDGAGYSATGGGGGGGPKNIPIAWVVVILAVVGVVLYYVFSAILPPPAAPPV